MYDDEQWAHEMIDEIPEDEGVGRIQSRFVTEHVHLVEPEKSAADLFRFAKAKNMEEETLIATIGQKIYFVSDFDAQIGHIRLELSEA